MFGRKIAFWSGFLLGTAVGYIVGIAMPQEQQQRLREELVTRGEEVVARARKVGEQQARVLAQEARRRAEELAAQARERIPATVSLGRTKSDGAT